MDFLCFFLGFRRPNIITGPWIVFLVCSCLCVLPLRNFVGFRTSWKIDTFDLVFKGLDDVDTAFCGLVHSPWIQLAQHPTCPKPNSFMWHFRFCSKTKKVRTVWQKSFFSIWGQEFLVAKSKSVTLWYFEMSQNVTKSHTLLNSWYPRAVAKLRSSLTCEFCSERFWVMIGFHGYWAPKVCKFLNMPLPCKAALVIQKKSKERDSPWPQRGQGYTLTFSHLRVAQSDNEPEWLTLCSPSTYPID